MCGARIGDLNENSFSYVSNEKKNALFVQQTIELYIIAACEKFHLIKVRNLLTLDIKVCLELEIAGTAGKNWQKENQRMVVELKTWRSDFHMKLDLSKIPYPVFMRILITAGYGATKP